MARAATVLIPIPTHDFDPTEVAVSWRELVDRGHTVRFATPDGQRGHADAMMLHGEGLDLWGWVPGLRKVPLLGLTLRADGAGRRAYRALEGDREFLSPRRWRELDVDDYDGLLLPGGHRARGMREYLEDEALQRFVGAFFDTGRPVAAICHGTVLAARASSPRTGRSALHGRTSTGLTWNLEGAAFNLMRFAGRVWDPHYYRTYREEPGEPHGHRSVQSEVTRALGEAGRFVDVPDDAQHRFRKASGMFRDRRHDDRAAFVVTDGNYVSARWPGDAHTFARRFAELLERDDAPRAPRDA